MVVQYTDVVICLHTERIAQNTETVSPGSTHRSVAPAPWIAIRILEAELKEWGDLQNLVLFNGDLSPTERHVRSTLQKCQSVRDSKPQAC